MPTLLPLLLACSLQVPETTGTIVGQVVDGRSHPVGFANVIAVGTRRGAQADESGHFALTLVPPGPRLLRILVSGYPARSETLTVVAGMNRLGKLHIGPAAVPGVDSVGPRFAIPPGALEARLIPARRHFKLLEPLAFEVRIYNRSERELVLVKCNASSNYGGSPRAELRIAAPFDAYVNRESGPFAFCGNVFMGNVGLYDFILVEPGEYFDPFMSGGWPIELSMKVPTRPGHYTATFRYSTFGPAVSDWTNQVASAEFVHLIERVPLVELVAKADFKVDY